MAQPSRLATVPLRYQHGTTTEPSRNPIAHNIGGRAYRARNPLSSTSGGSDGCGCTGQSSAGRPISASAIGWGCGNVGGTALTLSRETSPVRCGSIPGTIPEEPTAREATARRREPTSRGKERSSCRVAKSGGTERAQSAPVRERPPPASPEVRRPANAGSPELVRRPVQTVASSSRRGGGGHRLVVQRQQQMLRSSRPSGGVSARVGNAIV